MFSAIILICSLDGCISVTPQLLFNSMEQCVEVMSNRIEATEGHTVLLKCVNWGTAL